MLKNIYKLNQNSNLLNKYNKQIEINKQQIYFKQNDKINNVNSLTLLQSQILSIYYNIYFNIEQLKNFLLTFSFKTYFSYN